MLFDGGTAPLAIVRPETVRAGRPRTEETRCRAAHGLHRHRSGRQVCGSRTTMATSPGTRWAPSCGPRGPGAGARRDRWPRPPARSRTGRAASARQGPHHSRPSRHLGDRGHDEPGQAAWGRRGRHAGRPLRGPQGRPGVHRPDLDKPFRYRDLGSAAYISRGRAVVSTKRLHFGGFLGWVAWLFIHIGFLTGWRNRVGALFSWWFAFVRDIRRERGFTIDEMAIHVYSEQADAAGSGRHAIRRRTQRMDPVVTRTSGPRCLPLLGRRRGRTLVVMVALSHQSQDVRS